MNLFNQSCGAHITPLVINNLRGGHTHMRTDKRLEETRHTPVLNESIPEAKGHTYIHMRQTMNACITTISYVKFPK